MNVQLHSPQQTATPIEAEYRRRTKRSRELFERAEKVIPGGNSRHSVYWEPYPLFISRAAGTKLIDADNNEYLDLTYNYTAMVHGHAYPPILEAVEIARGTGWAANCEQMIDVAEQLTNRVESVDQVRFTNSGTEAAMAALQVARTLTGRHKILMPRYGYHGALHEHESGTFDHPGPATFVAEYNNLESFEAVLQEHGHEIAAVFAEPVLGSAGIVPAESEFIRGLRNAAQRAGALFVVDEVIAFRLSTGGFQKTLDVTPDLTMFGKLIGGGFPVGALGGRKDLMDVFDPADLKAFHSGTFNANPVTMAAGAASIRDLTTDRIDRMHALAARLETGARQAAARLDLPFEVSRVGSLLNFFFQKEQPESNMNREDLAVMNQFHLSCLNHGLFIARRGLAVMCTLMDESITDEAAQRLSAAMTDLAHQI